MSRVLVTGATGFVGRVAVAALAERGLEIHAAARLRADDVPADACHEVDLLAEGAPEGLVRDAAPTHLLHLAWTTEHGRYWHDPANTGWTAATMRLFESFAAAGGTRIVFAGSCAQYDWNTGDAFSETASPRRPTTPYGEAKQAVEEGLERLEVSSATALIFFPYGPHEAPERLVPSLTLRLLAGEEAPASAGTQIRDFIHVEDCAAALAELVCSGLKGPVNIASGEPTSVAGVAQLVAAIVGRPDLLRLGALPGDDRSRIVAVVDRLRDELGFAPSRSLEDGLRATVEWWGQRIRRR